MTAGALARATGLTTGGITNVLDRLEDAGYVRRAQSSDERRKVFVETTPAFHRKVVPLFEPMHRLQSAVVSAYSPRQLQVIASFTASNLSAAREALTQVSAQALHNA
jgi:DNA-binding MarR family transcriptional regulator